MLNACLHLISIIKIAQLNDIVNNYMYDFEVCNVFANAKNSVLPRKLRQVTMMRRFETMMATATTKIRLACMRASNECSSMPPPFRAASPHPPLDAFTLHPFCDLSAARCRTFLEAYSQKPSASARTCLRYVRS